MFTESALFYDLLYSFKDYLSEADAVTTEIRRSLPDARSVLDVGCGTAEHHRYMRQAFEMDGLDISADFILRAVEKNPGGNYSVGDMADFQLDRVYDVILCLFSSIGYVKSFERMTDTFRCFRRHIPDHGIVLVEPWMTPDTWQNNKLFMLTYESDTIKLCRMNKSSSEGKLSILDFHYLYATPEDGVRHFEERHELALFTIDEMTRAFEIAGFTVSYDPDGLTGRGLYSARPDTTKR